MNELIYWLFNTKVGHFLFLVIVTTLFYYILKSTIVPDLSKSYFIGSIGTSLLLSIFDKNTDWY